MKCLLESFVKGKVHLDLNTCEKVPTSFKEDNEAVQCLNEPRDVAKGYGEICYQMSIACIAFLCACYFFLLCSLCDDK